MKNNYKEIYSINDIDKYKEINPKFVYLTIPVEYVCIYHKLLLLLSSIGKDIIDDCNSCNNNFKVKNIIYCWNLFQSAIACKELGKDKEAEVFINYINNQINLNYNNVEKESYFPITITDDGNLKSIVTCGTDIKFIVDEDTGELYEQWLSNKDNNKIFIIEDDELQIKI